jgi:hypothetical protein
VKVGLNCKTEYNHPEKVNKKIHEIDSAFHLVMIVELFPESVILLKDLICASWDAVVEIPRNQSPSKTNTLPSKVARKFQKALEPEYRLYNFFRTKLLLQISQRTAYIDAMKEILDKKTEKLKARCNVTFVIKENSIYHTMAAKSAKMNSLCIREQSPYAVAAKFTANKMAKELANQ